MCGKIMDARNRIYAMQCADLSLRGRRVSCGGAAKVFGIVVLCGGSLPSRKDLMLATGLRVRSGEGQHAGICLLSCCCSFEVFDVILMLIEEEGE